MGFNMGYNVSVKVLASIMVLLIVLSIAIYMGLEYSGREYGLKPTSTTGTTYPETSSSESTGSETTSTSSANETLYYNTSLDIEPRMLSATMRMLAREFGFNESLSKLVELYMVSIRVRQWYKPPLDDLPPEIDAVVREIATEYGVNYNELREHLLNYGFAIIPAHVKDIANAYEYQGYNRVITVDTVLYLYHELFDHLLQDLEGRYFINYLREYVATMLDYELEQYNSLDNELRSTIIGEALLYNIGYYGLLAKLLGLDPELPPEITSVVEEEYSLVMNASGMYVSPLFGYLEDYTQYKPRGHYTRSKDLMMYFRAMMYMGRMRFNVYPAYGQSNDVVDRLVIQSILIPLHMEEASTANGYNAMDYWLKIYLPTAFIVGVSGDLTPLDYLEIIEDVYSGRPSYNDLLNKTLLDMFKDAVIDYARKHSISRIISSLIYPEEEQSLIGLRVMGQRFILDGYIHQLLCHSSVPGKTRVYGLEIPAAFGSDRAWDHLSSVRETYDGPYEEKMMVAREIIDNYTVGDWMQSLYSAWLYTLKTMIDEHMEGYLPDFMETNAYMDKALNTFLSSWAQLRHDTILYAKQPYAEIIALPPEPSGGWVEPYPRTYATLMELVNMTINGLKRMNLLDQNWTCRLEELSSLLSKLYTMSLKELSGERFSDEEIWLIKHYHEAIDSIIGDIEIDPRIIADVYTDPNTYTVLEVGTGYFNIIVLIYQDQGGKLCIGVGYVMSYYEFYHPATNRLTDEEWRQILDNQQIQVPEWIKYLLINRSR